MTRFFLKIEPLILLAVWAVLLFPVGWQALALLILPLIVMNRRLATGHFFPRTPFDVAFLLLLTAVLVSLTIATFDITLSLVKIAGVLTGMSLYYTAVTLGKTNQHGRFLVLSFFLLAGTGIALAGLLGTRWPGPFAFLNRIGQQLPFWGQIPGTIEGTVSTNELAGVLDWVVPIFAALAAGAIRQKRILLAFLLLAGTGFTAFILLATQSRGGILAMGVTTLVMLALAHPWGRWLATTATGSIIGLLVYFRPWSLIGSTDITTTDPGLTGRLEIWSRAIYALQDFPFTGVSMNGFRVVVHILYPLFLIPPDRDIAHAHNHILQAGLDLGFPGMIAYLASWFVAIYLLWCAWRTGRERPLTIGLIGAFTAAWVYGIFDVITLGARPGFLWWILLAITTLHHEHTQNIEPH
ncbi:MAG: O-antigen ligase domain-containing protein [Chloroflexi bacterium]|nr:MAG: O-antigen ligase domain-containing protein [Chloroflexota bacterium]